MLKIGFAAARGTPDTLALPVAVATEGTGDSSGGVGVLLETPVRAQSTVADEARAFLDEVEHGGNAGVLHTLPRPLRRPGRVLLVGIGDGDEAGWRAAGAAVARAVRKQPSVTVGVPSGVGPAAVRGLAEGIWLAAYRYRLKADPAADAPKLGNVSIMIDASEEYAQALAAARATAEATLLARDLTNVPSDVKTPAWFARRITSAAKAHTDLSVDVRKPARLKAEGFGGILAVGAGSVHPTRLVELSWRPPLARTHVVLVGKGITFDTGGVSIKTRDGMLLMRKDMGGAATVMAATLGAAALDLPVRITALAPLAENMPSGSAFRPGDVVRHYGGATTEVLNTDAEGRVVLADALAYAAERLEPDVLIDLATLTGAQGIALGRRTAALFSDNDALAAALIEAATRAGEQVWRMPLVDDYVENLASEVADQVNSTEVGAGSVMAALYLRGFAGAARDRWAHLDMSSPAWSKSADGELAAGATGWGVRTLLRWLENLSA